MNFYLSVFTEAAHAASIIPFANNVTLFAMRGFGGFDMQLASTLAIAGATLGSAFNYALGACFSKLPTAQSYTRARAFFQRYGVFLLPFSFLPMLNFASLAAGFLCVRARVALPLCLISWAGYYDWFLLK